MKKERILDYFRNHTILWLIFCILAYVVILSFLSFKKYGNFLYNANDLAIFSQVFFNTAHGNWLNGTVNINSYLADHFTPIIFLLLPLYKIWPDAKNLLLMQSIFLGLAAWPLYKISLKINKNKLIALIVAIMWLLNPLVQTANLFEFHLLSLAPFFIFWTFYFYKKNNFKLFILFLVLSLIIREDISLVLLGFFSLSLIDKKTLKWKAVSLFLPLLYFILAIKIVHSFATDGGYKFFIYYGWLGGHNPMTIFMSWFSHPLQFLWHLLSPHNFGTIIVMLLPLLFIPLLRKKYLWLAVIPLGQFWLTSSGLNFMIYSSHYGLFFMPAIFLSFIYALDFLKNRKPFIFGKFVYNNFNIAKFLLLITVLYFSIFLSPVKNILLYNQDSRQNFLQQDFLHKIETNKSVASSINFLPHLSNREILYPISYAYFGSGQFAYADFDLPLVDYILVDYYYFISNLADAKHSPFLQQDLASMPANWQSKLDNYSLVSAQDNMYLWRPKNIQAMGLKLFEIKENHQLNGLGGFVQNYKKSGNYLTVTFYNDGQYKDDYLIRFYGDDDYQYDLPLGYAILPPDNWSKDKLYTFYYYPSKDIKYFQVFSWQGENKMGHQADIIVDLELQVVTNKIKF